jgi:hypothetical protein
MGYHSKSPEHSNFPLLQYSITVDSCPFYPIDARPTRMGSGWDQDGILELAVDTH